MSYAYLFNSIYRKLDMVKYPGRREEVLEYIRLMADPNAAYEEWVGENRHPYDGFDAAIKLFFDLTPFERKEHSIGYLLRNEDEWHVILELKARMKDVFDAVGAYAPDEEYLSDDHWPELVKAAKKALAIFEAE